MVLQQVDSHQGRGRLEQLSPDERTDEALSQRFRTFAAEECSGESGLNVFAPTYEALSITVANNRALLGLAREANFGQPIPNLLFSAVKRVLSSNPDAELAEHYVLSAKGRAPSAGLGEAFANFCSDHRPEILELVRSRRVQTNEIRRCSALMPAFGIVTSLEPGRPLALIDVGASAGLNLLWDQYRYAYSDGSEYGPAESPALIDCEARTPMPDFPKDFPTVGFRVGIDLNPVDLRDDEQYKWMAALVWPDHPDRAALLSAARSIWLEDPPAMVKGDAVEVLPGVLNSAPRDATLCVFHCHTLNQFPVDARRRFYDILKEESERRTLYHVLMEGEEMSLDRIDRGNSDTVLSARRNAHGRWVEWETLP